MRAAATGISGIVAPDGTWRVRAELEQQAAVTGFVGPPAIALCSNWAGPHLLVLRCVVRRSARGTNNVKRKFGWKHVAWVVGTALAVWIIVGVVLAGRDIPPYQSSQQMIDLHGGHVQNNRITTKSWSFDYTHAQLSPDGTSGNIDGVRNGIVFRKAKPYLKIAAEHIAVNISSLDFTAIGKVHVERINDPQKRSSIPI